MQYIQSSGTQYIDTGFKPNQDTRVKMDVYLTAWTSVKAVFGARNGTNTNIDSFLLWAMTSTTLRTVYGTNNADISVTYPIRVMIDKDKNVTTVNGGTVEITEATFQSDYSLTLMALNDIDGVDPRMSEGKLYSCQIWDNGSMVRDYIPCINPNNAVGLYDMVYGVFYGNAGTGAFTAGPSV